MNPRGAGSNRVLNPLEPVNLDHITRGLITFGALPDPPAGLSRLARKSTMGTPARRSGGMWQRWVSTGMSVYRTSEMGFVEGLWLAACGRPHAAG